MSTTQRQRIARVIRSLKAEGNAALLLGSAPQAPRSHDTAHPYRQDSNFYYLTGTETPELLLLLRADKKRPILIASKPDAIKILWDGKQNDPQPIARSLGAELIIAKNPVHEAKLLLRGVDKLYFQNLKNSPAWAIAHSLMELAPHERSNFPLQFDHLDCLLEEMRLFKSKEEVAAIRHANAVGGKALHLALPMIRPGMLEASLANYLRFLIGAEGCGLSFDTIVGAGKSAATLHYIKLNRTAKRGEMLLVDWGAEYKLYAGDMTRVLPIGGKFDPLQSDLYDCVLAAQKAAIKKIKSGARTGQAYDAAAKILTLGLKEVGVLKGKTSSLLAKKAYKPYFPHGIGHSLGLDVHDVGRLRGNNAAVLEAGMVLTVEPGLYFPKKIGRVPPCGIRIEDDVLITKTGCQILSATFPKERKEVEDLFN